MMILAFPTLIFLSVVVCTISFQMRIPLAIRDHKSELKMAGFGKAASQPQTIIREPLETDPCACGSSKPYSNCCKKYHSDTSIPMEPEDLVRARFSAFIYSKISFLLESTHPDSKYYEVDEESLGSKRTKRQIWFKQMQARADEMDFGNLNFLKPSNVDDKLKTFLQEKGYFDNDNSTTATATINTYSDDMTSVLIALDRKPKSAVKFDKVLEKINVKKAANGGYLYIGAVTEMLDQKNPQSQKVHVTYKSGR